MKPGGPAPTGGADQPGDPPDAIPTVPAKVVAEEPALGTMQLPFGAPPAMPGGGPPEMPAPLHTTMVPSTSSPLPVSAPPAMPQDGRYAFQSEIARGGMGRVVEATDTVLGRTVALKEALSL